jgi:hypothetical protein
LTRLRTLFLFAALLALATAFVACGGGGSSDPQSVLDDATLQGVESGDLDLSLGIDAKGEEGGHVDVSLAGPFQSEGEGQLPRLDLSAKANGSIGGEDVDFEGSLVLLPNKAYVGYEGTDYEVDPTTFSFVKATLEEAQQSEGADEQSAGVTACQEAAGELNVGDFADNLVNEGSADVGGTSTTEVSGDLDVPGAIDALVELAEEPACQAQLGAAGPLPSSGEIDKAKEQVESALKSAHVEVDVGGDDIVRRIAAQLSVEPERSGSGPKSVDVDFELTLTGVNDEQSIAAPQDTKPLNDLFLKLGVNPIELLGLLEGGGGLGGGGIGDLLGEIAGGGSGSGSGGGGSGGGQSYTECLQGARSAADIEKCGSKLR